MSRYANICVRIDKTRRLLNIHARLELYVLRLRSDGSTILWGSSRRGWLCSRGHVWFVGVFSKNCKSWWRWLALTKIAKRAISRNQWITKYLLRCCLRYQRSSHYLIIFVERGENIVQCTEFVRHTFREGEDCKLWTPDQYHYHSASKTERVTGEIREKNC